MQWYGALLPRIHAHVPANHILEIAPGFGRWTQFLKDLCRELTIVDLSAKCIETCRERFAAHTHIHYYINDGTSLPPVADHSIDFIFCFDSLVHAEKDVLACYINECARVLAPEGFAFIHHSNLGGCPEEVIAAAPHMRAPSMSAAGFAALAQQAGLYCPAQEIINWGGPHPLDCLSTLCRPASPFAVHPPRRQTNLHFMEEAVYLSKLNALYARPESTESV
jgi:SAM-dependent methyltransferase